MAYETPGPGFTLPASTGLKQFRFVSMSGTSLAYPAKGAAVVGVTYSGGTTGSTRDPQYLTVVDRGIVKVEALTSTLAAGDLCSASSVGYAIPSTAGAYAVGRVVAGSSGGTGRVLSVQLLAVGTT